MAYAVGMFIFFRSLGQCFGVAVCGSIFQNQMKERLLDIESLASRADQYSKDASGLAQTIKSMPANEERAQLVQAFADSLKIVWVVMCALSGVASIGSFFVRDLTVDREHRTEQGLMAEKQEGSTNGENCDEHAKS